MGRKRKLNLKKILDITSVSNCNSKTESAPPLDIPYPKIGRNLHTNKVRIDGKMSNLKGSIFNKSTGDEPGTKKPSLMKIFSSGLTNARKIKKK